MGEKRWKVALAVVVLLGFAGVANANPVLSSSATLLPDLVTWQYSYVLSNPSPTPGSIFDLYVPAWGNIGNVTSPAGWNPFWANGFVQWTANFGAEVLPDATLGGFSFTSDRLPAYWTGIQVSTDDGQGNIVTFDVLGAQPVPEPTAIVYTITAIGFGAGFFGLRSRKSLQTK